jgi:thiamine kinase
VTILEELVQAGVVAPGVEGTATTLTGGYWNLVVRLDLSDGRRWVAKRFTEDVDNPYFPVQPDTEATATLLLGGTGIAAEHVAYLPHRRLLVTEFVEGQAWDGSVTDVARLLRRVHAIDPGPALRALAVGTASVMAHARAILDWGDVELDLPRPKLRVPGRAGSLVHTDCGPGNMISAPGGLHLIDWQCPGNGDPVEDLACFASPAMQILYERSPLARSQVDELLAAYSDDITVERFHRLRHAYHWRIAAYCLARAARLAHTDPKVADRYRRALAAESRLVEELA